MRKKLLALLLATSTISSTLLPGQCAFADTNGSTDVTIEESSAGTKPTPTPTPTRLFKEITNEDYENLKTIPYGEIKYGNEKRMNITSEADLDTIKAKHISDAYPISHEDIFIPENSISENSPIREKRAEEVTTYNDAYKTYGRKTIAQTSIYNFEGFRHSNELSEAAKRFINSQQPAYRQEAGDCSLNSVTELLNKALIAQGLIPEDQVHNIRMSRAQLEYNALYVTKDPLNGFHGDYSADNHYSLDQKKLIVSQLKPWVGIDEDTNVPKLDIDLRWNNESGSPFHSLYSGMGPVSEKIIGDERAYTICNNGSIERSSTPSATPTPLPANYPKSTPLPHFVDNTNDLYTEDVYNNCYAHLTQCRVFPNPNDVNTDTEKETIRNEMKTWIFKYGGVGIDADAPDGDYFNFTDDCMYSIKNPGSKNHGMIIVGWDDTFPCESFKTKNGTYQTKTNGAWLIKNSWSPSEWRSSEWTPEQMEDSNSAKEAALYGKELVDNDINKVKNKQTKALLATQDSTPFSFSRYFWVSYDTPGIKSYYGIAFESKDYYNHIYQYDGYQKNTRYANSSKAANVFTVNNVSTTSDKSQELKCVGFEIYHDWSDPDTEKTDLKERLYPKYNDWKDPVRYEVKIYKNVPNNGNPESGDLVDESTTTGICPERGIYTVDLKKPVSLKNGDRFSVVVTLENTQNSNAKIAVEQNKNYEDDLLSDPRSNHYGESFIFDSSTQSWTDIVKDKRYKDWKKEWPENVRIKAMTVNTDDPTPTVAPTSTPVSDCAKLSLKAKINGGLIGFECMIETDENSPLADQITKIQITRPDSNGNPKTTRTKIDSVKKVNTGTGSITRSVFMPINPTAYENTYKFELLDSQNRPINIQLPGDGMNKYTTAYTISMKEYLDKLKDATISNNDTTTENFANALMVHMACAQNIYKTKPADDIDIDLSALNDINVSDFSGDRVTRRSSDPTDDSIIFGGLSYNWTRTSDLSVIYNVTDASAIKSIQIDGNDISDSSNDSYQIDENNGQQVLTVNLSGVPISDFAKKHTITVENENGNQVVVNVSVYSYIYSTLKTKYTDQTTKNYAKSLALLKRTYDQLDKNDSRYKDFFIF